MHKFCCDQMKLNIAETQTIQYGEVFDEYGIPCAEDGVSVILIDHCPWCGKKLPESKREEWFDKLEKLGFYDPLFDDDIPEEFKSAQWREKE